MNKKLFMILTGVVMIFSLLPETYAGCDDFCNDHCSSPCNEYHQYFFSGLDYYSRYCMGGKLDCTGSCDGGYAQCDAWPGNKIGSCIGDYVPGSCWNGGCSCTHCSTINECAYNSGNGICNTPRPDGLACGGVDSFNNPLGKCVSGTCCMKGTATGRDKGSLLCCRDSIEGDDGKCYSISGADPQKICTAVNGDYDTTAGCCGVYGIRSPGFESSKGWTLQPGSISGNLNIEINSLAFSGKGVLHSTLFGTGIPVYMKSAAIPLQPNKDYSVSFWANKQGDLNSWAQIDLLDGITPAGGFSMPYLGGLYNKTWNEAVHKFNSGSANIAYLFLAVNSPVSDDVYFDNVFFSGPGLDFGKLVSSSSGTNDFICNFDNTYKWESAKIKPFQPISVGDHRYLSNGDEWFGCNPDNTLFVSPANIITSILDVPSSYHTTFVEGGSSFTTGDTSGGSPGDDAEYIPEEEVLSGITGPSVSLSSSIVSSGGNSVTFEIDSANARYGKISLKITGLPAGQGYQIKNSTDNYKIKVSEGNTLVKTIHSETTTDSIATNSLEIIVPSTISKGMHNLNITILDSTNKIYQTYLIPNAFRLDDGVLLMNFDPLEINERRFLCYKQGTGVEKRCLRGLYTYGCIDPEINYYGEWAECCGPSFDYCINPSRNTSRISGGPIGLLQEYYGSDPSKNYVRKVNAIKHSNSKTKMGMYEYKISTLQIGQWDIYDTLEFDIFYIGDDRMILTLNDESSKPVFQGSVNKYSLTGSSLNKWHHVSIPIDAYMKSKTIKSFSLKINGSQVYDDVEGNATYEFNGIKYMMGFAIDRIFLKNSKTMYCGTDYDPYESQSMMIGNWTSDLDENRDACNAVSSYGWTADPKEYRLADGKQHCCGDDQTSSLDETFIDTHGACWKGIYVANNSVVDTSVKP